MLSYNKDTWGFKSTWHIFQATVFFLKSKIVGVIWGHIGYTPCSQRLPSRNVFKHSESLFLVVLHVDSEILFSVCLLFFFFVTDFRPPLKTTFSAKINGYYADLWKKEPNIAWSVFIDEGWLMVTAVSLSAQLRRNDWSWSVVYLLTIDRSWKQPEARNC